MKVLIQDPVTCKYLSGTGRWSPAAADGEDFFTTENAFGFARSITIFGLRIVNYFPGEAGSEDVIVGAATTTAEDEI